eukprot:TRINITY_DN16741_c0_g1_i1.p1 TRINITY_DN16741_c0_g1~~TRINITY_DN16741_c0_g1_i1.p1  ORF type:complete len:179 (+),score=33.45 TRINITY_DN16741_c0_g1_i1:175-711(+)
MRGVTVRKARGTTSTAGKIASAVTKKHKTKVVTKKVVATKKDKPKFDEAQFLKYVQQAVPIALKKSVVTHATLTPFRKKVLLLTAAVPIGRVTSYREIGRFLACGSSQAIGQALKHNPLAPAVPCHRVISASRTIGGFSGMREGKQISRKYTMLKGEGVRFDPNGKLAKSEVFFSFSL